jgi:D-glycero-D-manno-heptose 1,7-bisphosphate phosphatase
MAVNRSDANRRPAVFLDKDGTLVENVPYNADPSRVRLVEGAGQALKTLQANGFALVIASNQSGVARGLFDISDLRDVARTIDLALEPFDVSIDAFYCCPHHPDGIDARYATSCSCRKPKPGLLHRAAIELGIDVERSWMVGDILDDVEAGRRAGCRTMLVCTGGEDRWDLTSIYRIPHVVVRDLPHAARAIVEDLASARSREPRAVNGNGLVEAG